MSALRALAYADSRVIQREIRDVFRRPVRLTMWVIYAVGLGFAMWVRTLRGSGGIRGETLYADLLVCGYIAFCGITLIQPKGFATLFRNVAEARFLVSASFSTRSVVTYLAIRSLGFSFVRAFVSYGFLFTISLPYGVSWLVVLRQMVLLVCGLITFGAIVLPAVVARGRRRIIAIVIGGLLAFAAAMIAVRNVAPLAMLPAPAVSVLRSLPHWHPSVALTLASVGDPRPYVLMISVAALAIAAFIFAADDAYPELYVQMNERLDVVARRRRLGAGVASDDDVQTGRARIRGARGAPRGVAAILWKGIVEARRRQHATMWIVGAGVFGVIAAMIGRTLTLSAAAGLAAVWAQVALFQGIVSGSVLARELRRPLFWLSSAPLFSRLGMLAIGHVVPNAFLVAVSALVYLAAGGSPLFALILCTVYPVFGYLVTTIGYALFALIPDAVDQGGPVRIIRAVVGAACIAPTIVVAEVVWVYTHALFGAFAVGAGIGITESLLLLAFAAWRLGGRMDRLTTAIA